MNRSALWVAPLAVFATSLSGTLQAQENEEGREETTGIIEEERSPTLAERIPSVTRRSFQKAGRLQFTPNLGLSLNDPFYTHVMAGAGLHYHFLESLSIGVSGMYSLAFDDEVNVAGNVSEFENEFDRVAYSGYLEASWSPFYGKLSMFAERVLHFDTFVSLGAGAVGLNLGDPEIAGTVAIGQHYFVNDWMSIRVELRDQIFRMSRTTTEPDPSIQNLLTFTIGLGLYVPSAFEREEL